MTQSNCDAETATKNAYINIHAVISSRTQIFLLDLGLFWMKSTEKHAKTNDAIFK